MVDPVPLPEYPRPQLRRDAWANLNGTWDYAITAHTTGSLDPLAPDFVDPPVAPPSWDGPIVVPFSPEAPLSGVNRQLAAHESLLYRRHFSLEHALGPAATAQLAQGSRVILHFGAVDQACRVAVNGEEVGSHLGGYLPFAFDITDQLRDGAEQEIIVAVRDVTDRSWLTRGKQRTKRGGIWYTPQSGIWQTVWVEVVPAAHITGLTLTPHAPDNILEVTVDVAGEPADIPARVEILADGHVVARADATPSTPTPITFDSELRLWSPDDPFLYDVRVTYGRDEVHSYVGMRSLGTDGTHLLLNGEPIFPVGLLDQGYWPDGLYTAPSDAALEFDIQFAKDRGFTMLRKHIKVESARWYYHCDRLGMLVWQDAVNGGGTYSPMAATAPAFGWTHRSDATPSSRRGFGRRDDAGRDHFEVELTDMITHLRNHPSIVLWVPFNEGWGQFDSERIADLVKELDPTRPVDHVSGWHDQGAGDLKSLHVYFRRFRMPARDHRVLALTEYGGYSYAVPGHTWGTKRFGYRRYRTPAALATAYTRLHREELLPAIRLGLGALVYTQLSDVEDEDNGLLTYDREVEKIPASTLRAINLELQQAFARESRR